jgi:hypothetical protein
MDQGVMFCTSLQRWANGLEGGRTGWTKDGVNLANTVWYEGLEGGRNGWTNVNIAITGWYEGHGRTQVNEKHCNTVQYTFCTVALANTGTMSLVEGHLHWPTRLRPVDDVNLANADMRAGGEGESLTQFSRSY